MTHLFPTASTPAIAYHTFYSANMNSAMNLTKGSAQPPGTSGSEVKPKQKGHAKGSKNRPPDPTSKNAALALRFLENVIVPSNYTPPKAAMKRPSQAVIGSNLHNITAVREGQKNQSASSVVGVPKRESPAIAVVGKQKSASSALSTPKKSAAAIYQQSSPSNTPKRQGRPPLGEGKSKSVSNTPKASKTGRPATSTVAERMAAISTTPMVIIRQKVVGLEKGYQGAGTPNTPKTSQMYKHPVATNGNLSTATPTQKTSQIYKPSIATGGNLSKAISNTLKTWHMHKPLVATGGDLSTAISTLPKIPAQHKLVTSKEPQQSLNVMNVPKKRGRPRKDESSVPKRQKA